MVWPGSLKKPLLVVSGPTASGKSSLAVDLALDLSAEVINVDSVQLYQGFDIGSAKILESEQCGVPHHLLDIAKPTEQFNAGRFVDLAYEQIARLEAQGKLAILAGGTNLYISSVLHGLAKLPGANQALRDKLEEHKSDDLHKMLKEADPEASQRLHINDRKRIIRALETYFLAGNRLSSQLAHHAKNRTCLKCLIIVLCWDRNQLYERINRRSEKMVSDGLLEEVQRLIEYYGEALPALKTIGYAEAVKVLKREVGESEMVEQIAQNTRRFAKRQMTFWRNEPLKRGWKTRPDMDEPATEIGMESVRAKAKMRGFRAFELGAKELSERVRERLAAEDLEQELWYVKCPLVKGE